MQDDNMDQARAQEIADRWMMPTEESSYMGGLEKRPILASASGSIEASVDLARKATGGLDILGLHDGLHGSTSYISRSLSFAWKRQQHASIAPGTSAILTPHCYQCPVASSFPKCEFLCLKASLE